ncbi:uncharacterized protein LOC135288459 [Passer domesticus]|uniref:uncharacterized protein LOC135288459 n=1 Tax=Passer domesticus TaxID=48849 RepID=UPI0030FF3213
MGPRGMAGVLQPIGGGGGGNGSFNPSSPSQYRPVQPQCRSRPGQYSPVSLPVRPSIPQSIPVPSTAIDHAPPLTTPPRPCPAPFLGPAPSQFPPFPPPHFQFPAAALGRVKGHRMEREQLRALVILGVLSLARGDPPDASSPFQYDWCHLRVGGLVVAALLSALGIGVLLSGKCKCRSKASRRPPPGAATPGGDRSLSWPRVSPECPQSVPDR